MFLTFFLLLVAFAMVLAVKARFESLPPSSRFLLLGMATLITAFIFTVEFFIWLKARWIEFLLAVEGIPWWVVALVFLGLCWGSFRAYQFLTTLNQHQIGKIFRENVTPHLKEMATDVRAAWKKRSWWRIWPRLRKPPADQDDSPPPSS